MATGQGTAGVYEIVCIPTGMRYIGSSVNMRRRMQTHRMMLASGTHHNKHLQFAINKYGFEAMQFSIIAVLESSDILYAEQMLLDAAGISGEELFNFAKSASAPMLGKTHSDNSKRLIGDAHIGHKYNVGRIPSTSTRANMSRAGKRRFMIAENRAAHLGKMRSVEHRAKLSEAAITRMRCAHNREKIALGVAAYFSAHPEARLQASKNQSARFASDKGKLEKERYSSLFSKGVECVTLNTSFTSVKEAAEMTGLSKSGVSKVCSGDRKQAYGLVFRFVGEEN